MTSLPGQSNADAAALVVLDAAVERSLVERVRLHALRRDKKIDAQTYIAGLKACRDVEDRLEPLRRAHGATCSLALETSR